MAGDRRPASDERYGQLVPLASGPHMPTAAEHAPFFVENRDRARAAWDRSDVSSPDGAERVWAPRPARELTQRLAGEELAVWVDGDVLHVLWRGENHDPYLGGGLQGLPLWPVAGTSMWEISLRIRHAEQALVSVFVVEGGATFKVLAQSIYRGPKRPAPRTATPLVGTVTGGVIETAHLDAPRGVTTYRHPSATTNTPVVLVADGQNVRGYAPYIEAAIDDWHIPAISLVGVHHSEHRHHEYLKVSNFVNAKHLPAAEMTDAVRRYEMHRAFIVEDAIAWIAAEVGYAPSLIAQGNSNGGAWALDICQLHPDLFGGAIAFSVAGGPPAQIATSARHRYVLAAGTLEPFRTTTAKWRDALDVTSNHTVMHYERVNGHDLLFWAEEFPNAIAAIYKNVDV